MFESFDRQVAGEGSDSGERIRRKFLYESALERFSNASNEGLTKSVRFRAKRAANKSRCSWTVGSPAGVGPGREQSARWHKPTNHELHDDLSAVERVGLSAVYSQPKLDGPSHCADSE